MTKTPTEAIVELARLAGQLAEVAAEQEAQVLHQVQAELAAIGQVPAVAVPKAQREAEIEASFDNMPV